MENQIQLIIKGFESTSCRDSKKIYCVPSNSFISSHCHHHSIHQH